MQPQTTPPPAVPAEPRGIPVYVLEAAGYGGAATALAATTIALGDIVSEWVQVITSLMTAVVLIGVGWFAGAVDREALHRMRSVLWFLGLLSLVGAVAVFLMEVAPDLDARWVVFLVSLASGVVAFVLWRLEGRSLQLIALYASLLTALDALAYSEDEPSLFGLGPSLPNFRWIAIVTTLLGAAAVFLGVRNLVGPRRTAMVLGSLSLISGALFLDVDVLGGPSNPSQLAALVASVVVLIVGTLTRERAPGGIGIVGILIFSATLVSSNVSEQGPAIVLIAVGLGLLVVAVALARGSVGQAVVTERRSPPPPPAP